MHNYDGQRDFSEETQIELEEAVITIDRERLPMNYKAARAEIERRKAAGQWNEMDANFRATKNEVEGSNFFIAIVFLISFFGLTYVYKRVSGSALDPALHTILFVIAASFTAFLTWRNFQANCPNCKKSFGGSYMGRGAPSLSRDGCIHCGYKA